MKMTEFTECLNQIFQDRNLNGAQAARMCGLDAAVISRWLSGKTVPKSWKRLAVIVQKLRLTQYEIAVLERTYRKAFLGDVQGGCFDEILKTLHTLSENRAKYQWEREWKQEERFCIPGFCKGEAFPVFQELNSKMEIIQCIQRALTLLAQREKEQLKLKLCILPQWLVMQLKQFENEAKNPVEMLICAGSKKGDFKSAEVKLKWMRQALDLLFAKNPIQIYFYNALDELGQTGQNWLVSDRFLIQFSADLSRGMVTQDKEWIAFFQESARRLKGNARQFCKCKKSVLDYLGDREQLTDLYSTSLDFMPCVSIGLTEAIVREGILPKLPFREEVIEGIMLYPTMASRMRQVDSYFSKEGLYQFMESGVVDLFPYKVYRPLPMEQRCEVLHNVISFWEENLNFHFMMYRDPFADMRGISIEQRNFDELHIYLNFEEGQKEEVFVLDPDVKKGFADFFRYLKESGFVYGEEETMAFMKGVLKRYQKRINVIFMGE